MLINDEINLFFFRRNDEIIWWTWLELKKKKKILWHQPNINETSITENGYGIKAQ
jgi:hypothetical protein